MNEEKIKFSIITPVYNRSDCIVRCIESVLNQDYLSYEIIIINDGSSDNTLEKVQEKQLNFSSIKIITYEENKGVNYARNRGIELAKGDFIIFLDSDDCLAPKALKNIDKNIDNYPGYDHYLFGVSDRANDPLVPTTVHKYVFADWLSENVNGDFAHVIRPSCFKDLLFFEEFRIYESLNWMRVLRKNKVQFFIPTIVLLRERDRNDSVSRELLLNDIQSIQNSYQFTCQYIDWYIQDFYNLGYDRIIQDYIGKAIILGVALGEKQKNEKLITLIENNNLKKNIYITINRFCPRFVIYKLIILRSLISIFIKRY